MNTCDPAARLGHLLSDHELSAYRANLLEQLFVVELIQACWTRELPPVEFARPFVDFRGYDLVASCGGVTRHIQLKATEGKITVHRALAETPSGCCVLLKPSPIGARIELNYRYFGEEPGQPLRLDEKLKPGRRSTKSFDQEGRAFHRERKEHVEVPKGQFDRQCDIDELSVKLFGSTEGESQGHDSAE